MAMIDMPGLRGTAHVSLSRMSCCHIGGQSRAHVVRDGSCALSKQEVSRSMTPQTPGAGWLRMSLKVLQTSCAWHLVAVGR